MELQRILADAWDEPRLDWARTRVPPADPQLVDAPRKLFLHAGDGQPLAVVLWSNDRAPELVARGQRTAAEARERLGPTLGSVILHPLAEGRACGSSFVVLPWCGSLAERGVLARIQRLRLRAPLLRWLRETAARTRAPAEPSEIRARLRALAAALDERSSLRRPLEAAFDRLAALEPPPAETCERPITLADVGQPDAIVGDGGKLPREVSKNTAGIAAAETLKLFDPGEWNVVLRLEKGLPLGSGLGSSGASAVAAAWAVNLLFGSPLTKDDLLLPVIRAEAAVSGWHADNVAPALFGGFVLIQSYEPLRVVRLPSPGNDRRDLSGRYLGSRRCHLRRDCGTRSRPLDPWILAGQASGDRGRSLGLLDQRGRPHGVCPQ